MPLLESSPAAQGAGITSIRRTAPARVRPSKLVGGHITTHFARFCLFSYKIRALGNELLVIRAPAARMCNRQTSASCISEVASVSKARKRSSKGWVF
jgi:hypothetical protein